MRQTDAFMGSRVTPASLESAVQAGRAVYVEAELGGEILGYAGIWDTPDPLWLELGAIWVAEERRKTGLGTDLYNRRLALIPRAHMVCVLTGSDEAAHLALVNGFAEVGADDWFDKVPVSVSCIPCDKGKMPGVEHPDCPLRAQIRKCRMFTRDFRE